MEMLKVMEANGEVVKTAKGTNARMSITGGQAEKIMAEMREKMKSS